MPVIGAHIGNYRIVAELGAGAMGEVYLAEHLVMGRRAAVKVIRGELSSNAEMVERFVNEARLVNRIGHPNIVEITDFGQIGSRYYIMMELLEGETLEARLERTPRLAPAVAQHIALQITRALGAAHELGVIHRDLKPENIFLVQRDTPDFVKVLDFGIAKLTGLPNAKAGTLPGTLLGTPHYMSPEQCHAIAQLDHRSDVYSLGVILYRMLTGALPFDSETLLGVLYAQANIAPRPPRELCPELPAQLEAVVLKAMAKAPDERFQDMASLRAALSDPQRVVIDALAAQRGVTGAQPVQRMPAATPESQRGPTGVNPLQRAATGANPIQRAASAQPLLQANTGANPLQRAATGANPVGRAAPTGAHATRGNLPPSAARESLHLAAPHAATSTLQSGDHQGAVRATDPAPGDARPEADPKQGQRVGSRLGKILLERIHKNRLILPAMPLAARECLKLVDDADGDRSQLVTAIGRDPVIAPLVLRRARSALLGTHTPVRTIDQAIARIGLRQLRAMLVDLCTRRLFESKNPAIRRATRGLWEHSLAVALLSRAIARRRRDIDPDAAYLAGLLHDVGKPIAASLLLEAERSANAKPGEWLSKDSWLDVITECHREVGVALARNWELQNEVVVAIARSERYAVEGSASVASVVCFANAIAKREGIYTGSFDSELVEALIHEGMILFQFEPELLPTLLTEMRSGQSEEQVGS